ncbi:glycoside hydrolase family 19 protein [Comamonas antarctica]|uniref:glycoside hydrolase family 19 protein n=1 Tax=Comamonas antarctica TaxID=2743470 RepID=UPI0028E5239A|nr:glycoside hydrolase family 19 protein [Comamonas antarctica]
MKPLTESLIAASTGATPANATRFRDALNTAMARFQINTPRRQAAFLATVGVESTRLTATEEDLYYRDPARLARIYPRAFKTALAAQPYTRNPKALGELLYKGYWGRGLIQLTWEKNYRAATEALGYDYLRLPHIVTEPLHAALTAGWYWSTNRCNEAADKGDMREVTRLVNGPALMHLAERQDLYKVGLAMLA